MIIIKIKEFINKYKLVLLGLVIFTLYFWNRFLRTRTSKVLPLDLNILRFFTIIFICIIFTYIVVSLIFPRKVNPIMESVIDRIFIPIAELDKYFKTIPRMKLYYEKLLDYLIPKLEYMIIQTTLFYIIFWLFPRMILLTALFIDVFIFHQLHLKYMVILFGLLLFINRYFKYSLKNTKKYMLEYYKPYISSILTSYYPGIHLSELEPDYDEDDASEDDRMSLSLDTYIEFYVSVTVYKDTFFTNHRHGIHYKAFLEEDPTRYDPYIESTLLLKEVLWEKYIGEKDPKFGWAYKKEVPSDYKNIFGDNVPDNYEKASKLIYQKMREFGINAVTKIMKIALILEFYNKTSNHNEKFRQMKILIYINYLLCWLYVLIISLPTLHTHELLILLNSTWINIGSPF